MLGDRGKQFVHVSVGRSIDAGSCDEGSNMPVYGQRGLAGKIRKVVDSLRTNPGYCEQGLSASRLRRPRREVIDCLHCMVVEEEGQIADATRLYVVAPLQNVVESLVIDSGKEGVGGCGLGPLLEDAPDPGYDHGCIVHGRLESGVGQQGADVPVGGHAWRQGGVAGKKLHMRSDRSDVLSRRCERRHPRDGRDRVVVWPRGAALVQPEA